jgi:hypothetical protein
MLRSILAFTGLWITTFATWSDAQSIETPATPTAEMKAPSQFPPSNVVLQTALNDLNRCIDNTIANAASAQRATTVDAVVDECAAPQAKLKQMLPPNAFDNSSASIRQRVDRALAVQHAEPPSP